MRSSKKMSEMDDLLPDFLAEAADNLERVNRDLDQLLSATDRAPLLDSIYRGVHTVKGGSSMFGFNHLKEAAHALETFLSQLKQSPAQVTEEQVVFIRTEVEKLEAFFMLQEFNILSNKVAILESARKNLKIVRNFIEVLFKHITYFTKSGLYLLEPIRKSIFHFFANKFTIEKVFESYYNNSFNGSNHFNYGKTFLIRNHFSPRRYLQTS